MAERMADIPVHDIKGLMEVPDISLYLFAAAAAVSLAVVILIGYWIFKWRHNRRENGRKKHLDALREIDFSDPKKAAYRISELGRFFAGDNERTEKGYRNLFERLEPYKYAKHVEAIDRETLGYFQIYLEMIDV